MRAHACALDATTWRESRAARQHRQVLKLVADHLTELESLNEEHNGHEFSDIHSVKRDNVSAELRRVHPPRSVLWVRRHICTVTGLTPATSARGLGSPLPHLHRDWGSRLPHLCRDCAHRAERQPSASHGENFDE